MNIWMDKHKHTKIRDKWEREKKKSCDG